MLRACAPAASGTEKAKEIERGKLLNILTNKGSPPKINGSPQEQKSNFLQKRDE